MPQEAPATKQKHDFSSIKGIGAATLEKLERLGVTSPFDLVLHLPLRYVDETHLTPIASILPGQMVQIEGTIVKSTVQFKPRRQLVCLLRDESAEISLRFINFYGSQVKQLETGTRVRVIGEMRLGFFGAEMVHPKYTILRGEASAPLKEALTPVYPTTAGLSQEVLRRLIAHCLEAADLSECIPTGIYQSLGLPSFADSIRYLHHPPPDASLKDMEEHRHPAWQRLIFDELLAQQLSMRLHYNRRRANDAPPLAIRTELSDALLARLPFALTGAQNRVLEEIRHDLTQPYPMQRLLQGDVGSGKTLVAVMACLQAIGNGYQAALMAPTEILAEQHAQKITGWLEPLGIKVILLNASMAKKDKDAALAALADGTAQFAVGTHALFQDQVAFANLGLVVVDEQHRFGVEQRLKLRQKGTQPHQLMMSATPIPRTLSMSYFADLDVSVIDELPPGRTPVVTKLIGSHRREEVIERVRAACMQGKQAYWVCPLIEESEALQLETAIDTHAYLSDAFPDLSVGLVHGRMKPAEKAAVMDAFKEGFIQLLVATTVIEVGVDVPNASLMIIEHAERMGLSQLHQLRGRVGRGAAASICVLLYEHPLSETGRARLKIIYESTDGFEIARKDLELRGPGEFLGARQSGAPMLKIADINRDTDLLEAAQAAAVTLQNDPQAAARHLNRWLGNAEQYLKV